MAALQKRFAGRELAILCFPCNQFGKQEPWPEPKIKSFVQSSFGIRIGKATPSGCSFWMGKKGDVNAEALPSMSPVWRWLKSKKPGKTRWNFNTMFIIDQSGQVKERLDSYKWSQIGPKLEALCGAKLSVADKRLANADEKSTVSAGTLAAASRMRANVKAPAGKADSAPGTASAPATPSAPASAPADEAVSAPATPSASASAPADKVSISPDEVLVSHVESSSSKPASEE